MFKNIFTFNVAMPAPDLAIFEAALDAHRFVECGASQEKSVGWIEPRGEKHGALVESVGEQWIMKVQVETKVLPGAIVKEAADKKIALIEQQTGRKPGKKETREIREDMRMELLPLAFTKKSSTWVWLDPKAKTLVIDANSQSRADDVVTMLVRCIEGLAVTQIQTKQSPSAAMSVWLSTQEMPADFTADRDCVLKATDESKASIRYASHALDIDEVQEHIAQGKMPTQLAMTWNGQVSFLLTDAGNLKRLGFLDVVMDDKADGFDGDVAISTGVLKGLIPALAEALGGVMEIKSVKSEAAMAG